MKSYWIKERYNPQLGTYYDPVGQISKAEAKRLRKAIYGSNIMLEFKTEEEYINKIRELQLNGEKVN